MKISELPTWNNTIPMGTYAVISVPTEGGTFKNYKLDMSSLTVSDGGGGSGGGGLTESDVRKIVNSMISKDLNSLNTILQDTLNGDLTK